MNVKKIIPVLLAVFLLGAVFCGAASAFTVNSEAVVSPSGILTPGEHVSASMQILMPDDAIEKGAFLTFDSPLSGAAWEVSILVGSTPKATKNLTAENKILPTFDMDYGSDVTLNITLNGSVNTNSAGSNISVLTVTSSYTESGGVGQYSSKPQQVLSQSSITSGLNALNADIQELDARIAKYIEAGCDVSAAQSSLEKARSDVSAAEKAGASDPKTAFAKLESAETNYSDAEKKLAGISLGFAEYNLTETYTIVQLLYEKEMKSEAMLLETSYLNLQNTYKQLSGTYTAGNLPDANQLDTLAADTQKLYNDAKEFENSSNESPLAGILVYLPFILIGLGAIAIIIVIVVVVVKKRKNNWDELG